MALKKIPQVQVGSFPPGVCLNAYIYNVDVNVGVNGEPTTVTLNLVNEDGNYDISPERDLSATTPFTIKIADETNVLLFRTMYLTSFEYSQNVGERTLDLTFTDQSIILDKIQVCLLNKEASPYNLGNTGWRGTWNVRGGAGKIIRQYNVPFTCSSPCERNGYFPWNSTGLARNPWFPVEGTAWDPIKYSTTAGSSAKESERPIRLFPNEPYNNWRSGRSAIVSSFVDKAMATNANLINGGAIIIGEEEFVANECSVPEVSYTFNELLAMLSLIGIPVDGLHDRGKPHLKQKFSGSLRDVLNDWCGIYGFSYVWNFTENRIEAVDLHKPQTDINTIHNIISNLGDDKTGVAVTNIKRSGTLDGTYNQDHISTFIKPSKAKTSEREFAMRMPWVPVTLNNIIPHPENSASWYYVTGGRTAEELIISSVLAKYNKNARTLYNYYLMSQKTNNFAAGNSGSMGQVLGLSIRAKLTDDEKEDLLAYTMSLTKRQKSQDKYGVNSSVFLGVYSEEMEDKWVEWEKSIADSIGKYYYLKKPGRDEFNCNGYAHWVKKVTSKPNSEVFDITSKSDLPFIDLLKHPYSNIGGKHGNGLSFLDPLTGTTLDKIFVHSRQNAYGFKSEDLDTVFFNNDGEELLKEHMPSHQPLEGGAKLFLDTLIERAFPNIYSKLEQIEDEKKRPSLFFFPTAAKVAQHLEILNGGIQGTDGWTWSQLQYSLGNPLGFYQAAPQTKFNKYEFVVKDEETDNEDCELLCDRDIFDHLCRCPEGDKFNPNLVGLTAPFSRFFTVRVNGQNVFDMTLPSEYPYQGYIMVNTKLKRIVNGIKQNFGILTNAGKGMQYRVNFNDITSDLDSNDDQSLEGGPVPPGQESAQITSKVLIPGTNNVVTAANYHTITNSSHASITPKETLSFTFAGFNFSPISRYITPAQGLTALSLSLGENGTNINFTFSSKTYPDVSDHLKMQRIGATRLNANSFMRTF